MCRYHTISTNPDRVCLYLAVILLSHIKDSFWSQVKGWLSKISWLISLVQHALCTLVIYMHKSLTSLGIPDETSVVILLATRSLFLRTNHRISTQNMLKTSTRQLLKDISSFERTSIWKTVAFLSSIIGTWMRRAIRWEVVGMVMGQSIFFCNQGSGFLPSDRFRACDHFRACKCSRRNDATLLHSLATQSTHVSILTPSYDVLCSM